MQARPTRGAALAALSIPSVFPLPPQSPATPQDNAFLRNRFVEFTPSDADIFVGDHAVGTRIEGQGTIDDRGTGTIIVRPAPDNGADSASSLRRSSRASESKVN